MRQLAVLVGAVLALSACGGGGAGGAGSPQPVSGSSSPAGPAVTVVEGVVEDAAGRPVRGALVVPRPADARTPAVPEIAVHSDSRGRFSWPLRPGAYEMVAQLGERRSPPVAVAVTANSRPRGVELTLPD